MLSCGYLHSHLGEVESKTVVQFAIVALRFWQYSLVDKSVDLPRTHKFEFYEVLL